MKRRALAAIVTLCWVSGAGAEPSSRGPLLDGDIVFQESASSQSEAIALATQSRYTHMGLIEHVNGRPMVLEAVGPVKRTPLRRWIRRGVGGHVVVKRLAARASLLTPQNLARMHAVGKRHLGKPYDALFGWDGAAIYCSELVYRVYLRGAGVSLGTIQRVGQLKLASPKVQGLIKARIGAALDLSEPIITPASIFADPRLETVEIALP